MFNYWSIQALAMYYQSSCGTPSLSSCALCRSIFTFSCKRSFATLWCPRAASALSFSNLIVNSCSSNSSFLSSIPNCMIWYLSFYTICSLFSCVNSVKSDDRLLGDVLSFFFSVGKSPTARLNLGVSTSIGLLLSNSSSVPSSCKIFKVP